MLPDDFSVYLDKLYFNIFPYNINHYAGKKKKVENVLFRVGIEPASSTKKMYFLFCKKDLKTLQIDIITRTNLNNTLIIVGLHKDASFTDVCI